MAVRFIFGRAGSGKTRHCLDALLAALERDEPGRLILLSPEQATFEMERALATRCRRQGFTRAEVLSFTRLTRCILQAHSPSAAQPLTRQQRWLALRGLSASRPDVFSPFGKAQHTPGFFDHLDRALQELLRDDLSPDEVGAAAAACSDPASAARLSTLGRVYAAYVDWLGRERLDPILSQRRLREVLPTVEWVREARIWVDGFAGFTGQESATLIALARHVRSVEITLMLDPADAGDAARRPTPLDLFYRTGQTLARLRSALRTAGVSEDAPLALTPSPPPRFHSAALARLEREWDRGDGAAAGASPGSAEDAATAIAVLECGTPREEVRRAARWIRRKLLESPGQLRLRDFAVVARELDTLAPLVEEVFDEFGLPVFIDRRRPLAGHALPRLVAALLEAVGRDFHHRPMAAVLRSGLTHLSSTQAEWLEDLILTHEVRGRGLWTRPEWPFVQPRGAAAGAGDEFDHHAAARAALIAALDPLADLHAGGHASPASAWARALHESLVQVGAASQLQDWIQNDRKGGRIESAELHRQAWDTLVELLDDVDRVLGDAPLTLGSFAAVLRGGLRSATVGLAPPMLDQVLVSSIERSRHPDVRYVWLMAFNDGVFPQRPSETPLLGEAERSALGAVAASLSQRADDAFHERLLAYIACTRASHGLVISYARSGVGGQEMHPSPLLTEVRAAVPGLAMREAASDLTPVAACDFAAEYLRWRAADPNAPQFANLARLREELRASLFEHAAAEEWLAGVDYRNEVRPAAGFDQRGELPAGVVWRGSPSHLETYLRCPFRCFGERGLRLRERRRPAKFVLERGQIMHAVLAGVLQRVIDGGVPAAALDEAAWLGHLRAALDDWATRQGGALLDADGRRPLVGFLIRQLRQPLTELVRAHAARFRHAPFAPLKVEHAFGMPAGDRSGAEKAAAPPAAPPYAIDLGDGQVAHLHGKIDRIDAWREGGATHAVLYDYKSRRPSPLLRSAAVLTGDWLQLMLYYAAVQAGVVAPGLSAAGVLVAPMYIDRKDLKNAAGPLGESAHMQLFKPRGLVEKTVAHVLAGKPAKRERSPVIQLNVTAAGGADKYSDVAAAGELEARVEQARATAVGLIRGMVAGDVRVAPLVENKTLACRDCGLRSVCRFELGIDPTRRAEAVLPRRADGAQDDVADEDEGGDET